MCCATLIFLIAIILFLCLNLFLLRNKNIMLKNELDIVNAEYTLLVDRNSSISNELASVKNELEIPREYLESEEYRTCRGIEFKDELSRKFFKKYLISMKNEDKLTALYDIMHCAWACDDHQDEANAVTSRKIAIELVDELIENIEDKET